MKSFLLLTSLLLTSTLTAGDSDYSIVIAKKFNNQLLDIRQDYDRDIYYPNKSRQLFQNPYFILVCNPMLHFLPEC